MERFNDYLEIEYLISFKEVIDTIKYSNDIVWSA